MLKEHSTKVIPSKNDVLDSVKRIEPFIHNTPVLTSESISRIIGANLFFKCENFQKMGAFKMRGAVNAMLNLSAAERAKGVVTHSSGNFAQAVALAAKSLKIKAFIVMPTNAPKVKKAAVLEYGAEVIDCPPTQKDREQAAAKIVEEKGATFIHPSNDIDVILGQGTAAYELIQHQKDLDYIFTPVGGGGLLAGTALSTHYFSPMTEVVGGEPFGADDAYHSLKAGEIIPQDNPNTIADGLRTSLGDKNFPIIQKFIKEIIRVEEDEIVAAMKMIWQRMKIVVEPSSAVALAAVIKEKERFVHKNIGIIISGGNVDIENLPF